MIWPHCVELDHIFLHNFKVEPKKVKSKLTYTTH